jgi:hypothetical protein
MERICVLFVSALIIQNGLARLLMTNTRHFTDFKPVPERKTFLTWDRAEYVNRQNDRQECKISSQRRHGEYAP